MKQVYHHWNTWECYKAGFYSSFAEAMTTREEAQLKFKKFLSCLPWFERSLRGVVAEWEYSCEHFLTNPNTNRIAWLGQAACAYAMGLPAEARGGFRLMSKKQQAGADQMAFKYLVAWERWYEIENKKIHRGLGGQGVFRWDS